MTTRKRDGKRRLMPTALSAWLEASPRPVGRPESPPAEFDWRLVVRRRLLIGGCALVLWTVGIEARLVYLQVFQYDELVARAERQQSSTIEAKPRRGEILDRGGRMLAYSVDADTIYAVPSEVTDAAGTARALCDVFAECSDETLATMTARLDRSTPFAYMRRRVSPAEARSVAALELEGVGFMLEPRRYYPNKELAAHVLGFVGIDNHGLGGIEFTYDAEVGGRPGQILVQTDARQRAFSRIERPPTTGATLELTIDKYLQHIAERELRIGIQEHAADGGTVVMLDPNTGEILALASEPTFNPNAFGSVDAAVRRNRAVTDIYEPGSTFKVVTASAAFEEGVVEPDEIFDVSAGLIRFGRGDVVHDVHVYDRLSFADVIVKSSNVGAIQAGLRLGPERLTRYVRRFGFGQARSPDFPGASRGIVWNPAKLTERALASVSMGYQVSVTPLQMATAIGAVANGGELLVPRVVRAITRHGERSTATREVVRRAITAETAAELTTIMEAVVARGTARGAQIPRYTVAGKTGTAEKVIDGRYSKTDHHASFVGFVPSRAPRLTILVMIDTPRGSSIYGGAVAAPIFRRIAEASLRHLAVPPTINPQPPVLVRPAPAERASAVMLGRRASAVIASTVETVSRQDTSRGVMPDLRGMSAREALEGLARLGLVGRIEGTGFVTTHEPAPGGAVVRGATATIRLDRYPSATREGGPSS